MTNAVLTALAAGWLPGLVAGLVPGHAAGLAAVLAYALLGLRVQGEGYHTAR